MNNNQLNLTGQNVNQTNNPNQQMTEQRVNNNRFIQQNIQTNLGKVNENQKIKLIRFKYKVKDLDGNIQS